MKRGEDPARDGWLELVYSERELRQDELAAVLTETEGLELQCPREMECGPQITNCSYI